MNNKQLFCPKPNLRLVNNSILSSIFSFIFLVIVWFLTISPTIINAQNILDSSFNGGVSDGVANNYVSAVQADGKILVGGEYKFVNGTSRNYLVRLNSDGTVDNSFNNGGSGPDAHVHEIVVLSDGKILIGGAFSTYNGTTANRFAKLNADGTLDVTFNTGSGFSSSGFGRITSIVSQPDGKLLVAGQNITGYNGNTSNGISRLNADGSFDNSFSSGFTTSPAIEQIVLQTDGKILIGGYFSSYGGGTVSGFIRITSNGSLDSAFNVGGSGLEQYAAVAGLAIQPNGKILIGGDFSTYNGVSRNGIARINTDGTLDTSFVPPTFPNSASGSYVEYFAIQTDGKILAAGGFDAALYSVLPLIRMNADGSLDNSFNNRAENPGYNVTLQQDGKVILSGNFTRLNGSVHNAIARINTNGTVDTSFNTSFTTTGQVNAITQQTDGKILVGGTFQKANGTPSSNVVRFNTDGTVDSSFAIGSGSAPGYGNSRNWVNAVAVQSDGKVLIGGYFGSFNGSSQTPLVRLNSNGSLDTSFNLSGNIFLSTNTYIESILFQPDGKIIISGSFEILSDFSSRTLLRLNSDGSVDTTFNSGAVTTRGGGVYDIVRQNDGKLIVVGGFNTYSGTSRVRIARVNTDGTLDTSFNPGTGANNTIYDAELQSDGKILIVGVFTAINGITRNRIARLNSDGSLDSSLDPGTGADNIVYSLSILPTGKIMIGGTFGNYNGTFSTRLARINPDGSLDNSFISGIDNNSSFFVRRVATQSDGKPLIGGTFNSYTGISQNNLARLSTSETNIVNNNGQILFVSNRDGNDEIYKMNPDGSNQQRLTNSPESESNGKWSPDNRKILYNKSPNSTTNQIWVMNADGSNQTMISDAVGYDLSDGWSPNGQKILFTKGQNSSTDKIWTMNADGSNKAQLTNTAMIDHNPSWSPDSSKISFGRCDTNYVCDIFTMNADGSNQTNLTSTNPNDDDIPKWTPDGSKIVFGSQNTPDDYNVYLMNANGTNRQQLTSAVQPQFFFPNAVSPNGSTIAMILRGSGLTSFEVATIGIDGNNLANLTNNSVVDSFGAWSPDSTKIAFSSRRDTATDEIYVMNANGSSVFRLTNNSVSDYVTDWQAIPSYTVSTPAGQNVGVTPTSNLNLNFGNVTTAGTTAATVIPPDQLQPLPSGFTLFGSNLIYDITTSAVFSGNITVTFAVPNVADAATCGNLRSLHYENGAWTTDTNATPIYNAGTQVCTVAQTVSSLSPFVVVLQTPASFSYEADVSPRPNGDGFVDADDIQQIRLFSVGGGLPYQSNEFQRVDCSPRSTLGDGFLDSDDVQQARRYSVGTDSNQIAGGPSSGSVPFLLDLPAAAIDEAFDSSTLFTNGKSKRSPAFRIGSQTASPNQTITIPVLIDTTGKEAGYTFSLSYDATVLSNPQVSIGNAGGDVVFNANKAGEIGFSVTSFSGETIASGANRVLVNVTFTVAADAGAGTTSVNFTDTLARRKASGIDPNISIAQPTYTGGIITVGNAKKVGSNFNITKD